MADLTTLPAVRRRLAATARRLTLLAVLTAYWPFLATLCLFISLVATGLFERLGAASGAGVWLGFVAALILAFLLGMRRYRPPPPGAALDALDRQSDLRPLTSLADRPAAPNEAAMALWRQHLERLREAARTLRIPNFAKDWRRLDPLYARYLVPIVMFAVLALNAERLQERFARAASPDLGALAGANAMQIEAWITPPPYSGQAPIFLDGDIRQVRVPAGSEATLRVIARQAPRLVLTGETVRERLRLERTPDGAFERRVTLTEDARLSLNWWGERAAWQVLVSPDAVPDARFVELPSLTPDDKMGFEWAASDDYGVERLELAISLRDPHPAAPEAEDRVPVPMREIAPKAASEAASLDFTRHRWAGLPVNVRLVAVDGAGQEGASETVPFILPEKLFLQPVAKAAQEIRVTVLREPRDYGEIAPNYDALRQDALNSAAYTRLDTAPPGVQQAALMLEAVTFEGARYYEDWSIYFALRSAGAILESAPDKGEADSVDDLLWAVALKAEYGSSADALRALLAARRALEKALRDGASEAEIKRLLEAFKEAANNYIAAKMAEAIANGLPAPPDTTDGAQMGGGPSLGGQDFADMLQALEDLAETGARDQARQLLSDITNMLENLQFQQGNGSGDGFPGLPGEGGDGEEGEELPEAEQGLADALERLSDLLREQRELNDDTLAEERGERGRGMPQPGSPGTPPGSGEQGELADRQRGLADETEDFAEGLGGRPGETGEDEGGAIAGLEEDGEAELALERARRLQERAARELERGNLSRARRLQDEATRALRDLSADLAGTLDELQEARREGGDREARDPFGRPVGGTDDRGQVAIPDELERQRAKDILDELRRRFETTEDPEERDYLERLLDRF